MSWTHGAGHCLGQGVSHGADLGVDHGVGAGVGHYLFMSSVTGSVADSQ